MCIGVRSHSEKLFSIYHLNWAIDIIKSLFPIKVFLFFLHAFTFVLHVCKEKFKMFTSLERSIFGKVFKELNNKNGNSNQFISNSIYSDGNIHPIQE